jgi:hypothetical protein
MLRRIQCPILESMYRMPVELDPSLIPACAIPCDYNNPTGYLVILKMSTRAEVVVHST